MRTRGRADRGHRVALTDTKKSKIEFHLTGPSSGGPSFDDVMKMWNALTGREATPAELAEAKASYDEIPTD